MGSFNYVNLQRRIQESMRDVRNVTQASRHNQNFRDHHLNLFLNLNNHGADSGFAHQSGFGGRGTGFSGLASELSLLFSQPSSLCKLHYSVNGGEWSDGIDLNLMNGLKKAPLNLVVSMPSEMDYEPELVLSRAGYFT